MASDDLIIVRDAKGQPIGSYTPERIAGIITGQEKVPESVRDQFVKAAVTGERLGSSSGVTYIDTATGQRTPETPQPLTQAELDRRFNERQRDQQRDIEELVRRGGVPVSPGFAEKAGLITGEMKRQAQAAGQFFIASKEDIKGGAYEKEGRVYDEPFEIKGDLPKTQPQSLYSLRSGIQQQPISEVVGPSSPLGIMEAEQQERERKKLEERAETYLKTAPPLDRFVLGAATVASSRGFDYLGAGIIGTVVPSERERARQILKEELIELGKIKTPQSAYFKAAVEVPFSPAGTGPTVRLLGAGFGAAGNVVGKIPVVGKPLQIAGGATLIGGYGLTLGERTIRSTREFKAGRPGVAVGEALRTAMEIGPIAYEISSRLKPPSERITSARGSSIEITRDSSLAGAIGRTTKVGTRTEGLIPETIRAGFEGVREFSKPPVRLGKRTFSAAVEGLREFPVTKVAIESAEAGAYGIKSFAKAPLVLAKESISAGIEGIAAFSKPPIRLASETGKAALEGIREFSKPPVWLAKELLVTAGSGIYQFSRPFGRLGKESIIAALVGLRDFSKPPAWLGRQLFFTSVEGITKFPLSKLGWEMTKAGIEGLSEFRKPFIRFRKVPTPESMTFLKSGAIVKGGKVKRGAAISIATHISKEGKIIEGIGLSKTIGLGKPKKVTSFIKTKVVFPAVSVRSASRIGAVQSAMRERQGRLARSFLGGRIEIPVAMKERYFSLAGDTISLPRTRGILIGKFKTTSFKPIKPPETYGKAIRRGGGTKLSDLYKSVATQTALIATSPVVKTKLRPPLPTGGYRPKQTISQQMQNTPSLQQQSPLKRSTSRYYELVKPGVEWENVQKRINDNLSELTSATRGTTSAQSPFKSLLPGLAQGTSPIQRQGQKPQQKTAPRQKTRQLERVGIQSPRISTTRVRPFRFWFPSIKLPKLGGFDETLKTKRPAREFRYTPSLAGIGLGVKAAKAPKFITGFELRPVITSKKPKRRRKSRR